MPLPPRKTVVLRFTYPRASDKDPLPLDTSRRYDVTATLDRETFDANPFWSPFGDEAWRDVIWSLRQCTSERSAAPSSDESADSQVRRRNRRRAEEVEEAGRKLYGALVALAPELRSFFEERGPRRLVIESGRAEIHALPWETLTNERREHAARHDLSIVRSRNPFHHMPQPSPSFLRVLTTSGPHVPERILNAVKSVMGSNDGALRRGIEVVDVDDDRAPADLVHIVAHGSQYDASVMAGRGQILEPSQLAETFKGRLMLLLWSCYGSNILATGDSVAMALQGAGNQFVLGFSAPLHFNTAVEIANDFYEQVLGARLEDPETAVTRIRQRLRDKWFEFGDWASMTLWLERPVDLSRLPLGRVRLPEPDWRARPVEAGELAIREGFEKAALGEVRLVSGQTIVKPLPLDFARQWAGPVIHLEGPDALRNADGMLEPLGIKLAGNTRPHDADLFLHFLDQLSPFRFALIVWSNVGEGHALLVQTLDRVPPNVGVLLISQGQLEDNWLDATKRDVPVSEGSLLVGPAKLERFLQLIQNERFAEALRIDVDASDAKAKYWNGRYFAAMRTGNESAATEALAALDDVDGIEADLLRGNFEIRRGHYTEALDFYQRGLDAAIAAGREREGDRVREVARIRHEIAFLLEERGDRGLAAQLFQAAIEQLNETLEEQRDSLWTSALARVLRDYAHLLAKDGNTDALPLIRRATAIHALEGRRTQVAYCFVTRGELACNLGNYDEADEYARRAAVVFDAVDNRDGWVDSVRLMARAAAGRNQHDLAIAILRRAVSRLSKLGRIGLLFLDIAETHWACGRIDDAARYANGAATLLKDRRHELRRAQRLLAVTRALARPAAAPRVATLAGRLMDAAAVDGSARALDRLRGRLFQCFVDERVDVLVCSAARGADLLALDVAGQLGLRRRVVLPFGVEDFRKTSVEKSQTDWNDRYQRVIDDVAARKDLVIAESAAATFSDANARILDEAAALAGASAPLAIVVWEGRARDEQDTTAAFKRSAESRGFDVREILIETVPAISETPAAARTSP